MDEDTKTKVSNKLLNFSVGELEELLKIKEKYYDNRRKNTKIGDSSSSRSRSRSRSRFNTRSTSRSKSRSRSSSKSRSRSRSRSRSLDDWDCGEEFKEDSEDSEGDDIEIEFEGEPGANEDDDEKPRTEVVVFTAEEINEMSRVELAQELDDVDNMDKNILEAKEDMKTRHSKEYEDLIKKQTDEAEHLDEQIVKNKRKRSDLEKAMCSRLKLPRTPKTPECPVCLEEMKPPTQIFNCPNGHLVCEEGKPKVIDEMCTTCRTVKYMGRATAVEQMIRDMFSI